VENIAMQLEDFTLTMFAACNSMRVLAYVPQIYKAAFDTNGASAISRTTWSLFLVANISTIAYGLVNRSDPWLAICFAGIAVCCVAILAITWWRGRGRAVSPRDTNAMHHSLFVVSLIASGSFARSRDAVCPPAASLTLFTGASPGCRRRRLADKSPTFRLLCYSEL
jgi:hypothetical protein